MRICLLSKMFPPVMGGSARYAYEIANSLGKRGHEVDVYTQMSESGSTLEIHDNVTVFTLTQVRRYLVTFETLYYSVNARFQVDFDDYDVIHGTLMPASTIALWDRRTFDTPIVLTSHSFAPCMVAEHIADKPADYLLKYFFHPMNSLMDRIAGRKADHVIAINREMKQKLISQYGIEPEQVSRVLHGVDRNRYRPRSEKHTNVSNQHLSILFVGRLTSLKRADLAIRALAESECNKVELLLAGAGRLEVQLKELAKELDVFHKTKFLGHVGEDLPNLYSSADVTIFTSNYEGFGLVFLESMASGTPVIARPVGGVPDIVEDGETGYIVSDDPLEIGKLIDKLATDPELIEEMSDASRTKVEHRSWDQVTNNVEKVYRRVLDV